MMPLQFSTFFAVLYVAVVLAVSLRVIMRRPPSSVALAWMVLVAFLPLVGAVIYLLIGEDNVATLDQWRRFDELKKLVHFVVLDRTGLQAQRDYQIVRRKIDISATGIRKRVAHGQSIRYLVPQAVDEIIQREKLYRE